jgi:phosphatidylserine/phosphatidylglycerophosphate/cardiolipin synthase-like enzyme
VTMVLSNAGDGPVLDNTNADARAALHAAGVEITDRMLGSGHIGHNKFVVYCDPAGVPRAVLTGSTNWTSTGLCTQSNNALIVDDDAVAAAYLEYWQAIKAESAAARGTQSAAFRTVNRQPLPAAPVDGGSVTLWRSPNTTQQNKPANNPARPVDLTEVFALIAAARHGAVFLLFQPGRPSVLDALLDAQVADPTLFVRGAATDIDAIGDYSTDLYHRSGSVAHVAAASAIKDDFAFWQRELLKLPGAHAIVHDKILVLDPFSPTDCVVITGSHNLGYRASYNNDDNLVVVRGNPGLAAAFTTHVLDVYDHYRWRYTLQTTGQRAWTGLSRSSKWQNKYFAASIKEEFRFFGG